MRKQHSLLASLSLFLFLSLISFAHTSLSAPQQQKVESAKLTARENHERALAMLDKTENANVKITPLDEKQLRENTLTRLKNTIKEQNPNAVGLELLTGDNITIKQKAPIKVGNTELWMVKIEFQGLPTTGPDDAKNIDMTMTVDPTGSYQFADITNIEKSTSMFGRARRELSKIDVPANTGTPLWKGAGNTDVIFISDPFCPFCRKEYVFLKENKNKIGSVKILHMPMPELHPTAKITSAILAYAKDKLPLEKFVDAVDFAYTDLNAGQENSKVNLQEQELAIAEQFTKKFPELRGNQDPDAFFYYIKGKYVAVVDEEAMKISKLFNVRGTPVTIIDGVSIRGFNKTEIIDALGI